MKILIVDDHAIIREGIAAMLQQGGHRVRQAESGTQCLEMIRQDGDIDALILDFEMPGRDGRSVLETLGKQHPDLPVIVLSSSEDPNDVRFALSTGALGYVPKSANIKTLLAALQLISQGDVYVPPLLLEVETAGMASANNDAHFQPLTERQTEVLLLIERGLSNKEIGDELGLSEKTVKVHVSAILRSLKVENRSQAAKLARMGTLKLPRIK